MSYGYQGYGHGHYGGGGYGGGHHQPPPGPPPGSGYGGYDAPPGPPPRRYEDEYAAPDGPPPPPRPSYRGRDEYDAPPGPPPRRYESDYDAPPGPPPDSRPRYGRDEYDAPPGPPPRRYESDYDAPPGPPPGSRSRYGRDEYDAPPGPPPRRYESDYDAPDGPPPPPRPRHGRDEYDAPPGPPPRRGYGGDDYRPPPGPPPEADYDAPPGPPPSEGAYRPRPEPSSSRSYGYSQAPPDPHPDRSSTRQYNPPDHPPPPGLDAYGYPANSGQSGRPHMPTANSNSWTHGNRSAPPPPPSGTQQFGHGAPDAYGFQYSNCTGKRKALLIGVNYFGQDGELRGCINDVQNISSFLVERYNYKREDMVILTDDQQNPAGQPTKNNILRAMHWLVQGAQPNDALFFHFSGHGGYTEDLDGDEDDGLDEVIYPVDFQEAGHIVDDEMHWIMVRPLLPGVRLTAIFDSCHSGTALDLPYIYSTKGVLKEPNLAKEAGQGLLSAVQAYATGNMGGVASAIMDFGKKAMNGDEAYEHTKQTRTSPADVIMWSGSKDDQTSADATIANKATGAMSHAFISALRANPQQSYVQLLNSIREILADDYSQLPQLSSSHPMDCDLLFVM